MLGEQVKEARIRHGLTQVALARLAGVPRSQLRKLEEGGNITLDTLRKILSKLPDLRSLSLGAVELHAGPIDPTTAREAITDLIAAGYRVLALFNATQESVPASAAVKEPPAGATRIEPSTRVSKQLEERLRRAEAEVRTMRSRSRGES